MSAKTSPHPSDLVRFSSAMIVDGHSACGWRPGRGSSPRCARVYVHCRSENPSRLLLARSSLLHAGHVALVCVLVATLFMAPAEGAGEKSPNIGKQTAPHGRDAPDHSNASGMRQSSFLSSIQAHDWPLEETDESDLEPDFDALGEDYGVDRSTEASEPENDEDGSTERGEADEAGSSESYLLKSPGAEESGHNEDDVLKSIDTDESDKSEDDADEEEEDGTWFKASLNSKNKSITRKKKKSGTLDEFFGTVPVDLYDTRKQLSSLADRFENNASPDRVREIEERRANRREADIDDIRSRIGAEPLLNMYTRAVETAPSTNFLGIGYDSIKGNPIGDPEMMVDPGLRSPVLLFSFRQDENGVTNDLNYLQPLGAYTRPFAACRQSETVNELETLADYQNQLSADASLQGGDPLGINSFSGSAGYEQFAREVSSKETKSFMIKTYCIRYEAGIAQNESFKWNYTLAFQDAVASLPTTFDGSGPENACTVEQWRQNHATEICQGTNIPRWINFIEQFGTHYTVRLYAGGKMTYQVTMKAGDVKKMKKRGVDVKAQIKLALGGVGLGGAINSQDNKESLSATKNLHIEKEAIVIGGKPPADVSDPTAIATWADSVELLPMPVKLELRPLQNLLPQEKKAAFAEAVAYYSKAYGMSLMDIQSLEGRAKSIQEVLNNTTQVAWGGSPPGFAHCPKGHVVLFGFAIKLNFKANSKDQLAGYHLVACTAGREKCDGSGTWAEKNDDERIYVVCGPEVVNEFYQVVDESAPGDEGAEANCPEDTQIALGFGLGLPTGFYSAESLEIEPCAAGQTSCTKNLNSNVVKTYVWMLCAEKSFPGIAQLHNVVTIGTAGKAYSGRAHGHVKLSCDGNERVVLGYAMEAHTRLTLCRSAFRTCGRDEATCELKGSGINKTLVGNDRHSLFGWLLCSSPTATESEDVFNSAETDEEGGSDDGGARE